MTAIFDSEIGSYFSTSQGDVDMNIPKTPRETDLVEGIVKYTHTNTGITEKVNLGFLPRTVFNDFVVWLQTEDALLQVQQTNCDLEVMLLFFRER